jgi:uncharacterized protein (DUF427 family)
MLVIDKVAAELESHHTTIVNPVNSAHFMEVEPVSGRLEIYMRNVMLANSRNALRVAEVGPSVYDPMFYIPREEMTAVLSPQAKTSICPLKGEAFYFSFRGVEVAWRYNTYSFADILADHFCFWPSKVRMLELPADG